MTQVRPEPTADVDARFSMPEARPLPWPEAREQLARAEIYWLTTVRPDGRPHVTPLIGIVQDDAFYFCTGPEERKARNLEHNRHCVVTTGCNTLADGIDFVIEGAALDATDEAVLQRLAAAFATKYGTDMWNFSVRDGAFAHAGQEERVPVYAVAPTTVFGFSKGTTFSQMRWRFTTP